MSEIRTNLLKSERGDASPSAPFGLRVSGVTTTGTLTVSGNATIGGNLGVAGTITYEDVARVDATGISTFREGFGVGPLAGIALTAYKDGSIRTSGIVTAGSYYGDGSNLTGISAGTSLSGSTDNTVCTVTGANAIQGESNVRIDSTGRLLIGATTEGAATADELTIETSGSTGMTIRSGTSGEGNIFFSDGTSGNDEYRGMLRYEHANNAMVVKVDTAEQLRIDGNRVHLKSPSGTNTTVRLQHTGNSGYGDIILDRTVNAFIIDNDPSNASNNQSYFSVKNKGTQNFHITHAGYITKPQTPHFAANGSPTIASSSDLYVAKSFGNVPHNVGSHYNNSNGRFTAPIAGTYLFGSALWCNSSDNNAGAHLLVYRKNGSEVGFGANHRFSGNQLHATMCIVLAVNDYVTTGFASGSGGSIQGSTPRNYFWGYLVG